MLNDKNPFNRQYKRIIVDKSKCKVEIENIFIPNFKKYDCEDCPASNNCGNWKFEPINL